MDPLLRQLVHVFSDEVNEQAQRITELLMAMEKDPTRVPTDIEELFREAHSLKGSSSSLGVRELEILAHTLEEALTPVRRGQATFTAILVDASLKSMDAARLRAAGLVADNGDGMAEVETAIGELTTLVASHEPGAPEQPARSDASTTAPTASVTPSDEAQGSAISAATSDGENLTIRIAGKQLLGLERRVNELRGVRGRLDHRTTAASLVTQTLERMWQEARAETGAQQRADALYQLLRLAGGLRRDLVDDAELVQAAALELDEDLRSMRMVPAANLHETLRRAVREACRRTGKDTALNFTGSDTQLDRRLLEQLKGPLVHLVRNAVDHGIEPAEVREAVSKSTQATVTVSVEQRGREILIEVRDDGRGIDVTAVRANAVERGFVTEAVAQTLSDEAVYELLFRSGLSTAETVTELSGRGVGLDVVRDAVLRLHGRVEISSVPGAGTTIHLAVPLTVAASEMMIIEESHRPFALPQSSLEQILRVRSDEIYAVGNRMHYRLDGQPLPVVRLAPLLGLVERQRQSAKRTVAIVRAGGARIALICDRLLGTRDLVLRPLPIELQSLQLLNAAAILPNGQAVFVLSARELIVSAAQLPPTAPSPAGVRQETVLVADDSITTRALLRTTLEASGFRVRTASDGDEALRLALAEPFDLVLSDVRMPRLDGFTLTTRLGADSRTASTPVVLFSSLDSDEDRRRGAACGARAYVTKSGFERDQLVEVVTRLIRGAP